MSGPFLRRWRVASCNAVKLLASVDLRPVARRPVLVIDRAGSHDMVAALGDNPSVVLPIRGEALFLPPPVLWRLLVQAGRKILFRLLGKPAPPSGYVAAWIETMRPDAVVTLIDNMYAFYEQARDFPDVTFIAIQNGYRLSERVPEMRQPPGPAWLLVMSEHDRQLHLKKGFSPERTVNVGSLRQSLSQRMQHTRELPPVDICIVSQWREGMFEEPMPYPRFSASQDLFHGFASRYAKERKLKLAIAGTQKLPAEMAYYRRFYPADVPVHWRADGANVYRAMQSANLILTVNSTAGREVLATGKRALFCDYPSEEQAFHDAPKLAPLFVTIPTYEEFERRVDAMLRMPERDWDALRAELAEFTHPVGRPDVCDKIDELIAAAAARRKAA